MTQKVRIGNDIRFNLTLRGPRNYDQNNIKELRCYLYNTSVCDCFCSPHAMSCFGRDCGCKPFPFQHCAQKPCAGGCGAPCYHCMPCGHAKYPYSPCDPAMGQGPLPPEYGCKCCCCDHRKYCRYGHQDPRSACFDMHPFCGCYGRPGHCDFIAPHVDEQFRFLAPSKVLPKKNRIQVYFPACEQFMCGDYKLVVSLVVYECGWGHSDLHTYTIDYGKIVTLVDDDSTSLTGDITIDVDTNQLANCLVTNAVATNNNKSYYMYPNTNLSLGQVDNYGREYKIMVTIENGAVMEYPERKEDWPYTPLKFASSDEDVIKVDEHGTIRSMNPAETKEAFVIVTTPDDPCFCYSFPVVVEGYGYDYIGFAPVRPFRGVEDEYNFNRTDQNFEDEYYTSRNQNVSENVHNVPQESRDVVTVGYQALEDYIEGKNRFDSNGYKLFHKVSGLNGKHHLENHNDGYYLWIVSRYPIKRAMMGLAEIPLTKMQEDKGSYYYCCPNPVAKSEGVNGGMDIDIELTCEHKNKSNGNACYPKYFTNKPCCGCCCH